MVKAYGKLPLHFEANQGQTDERVKFLSRGSGYSLFLTPEGAVLSLRGPSPADDPEREDMPSPSIRMKLLGSNPAPKIAGKVPLPGKSNYFIGNDPKKWRTNIPHHAKVEYKEVYPGIDLVFYGGDQGKLEYDFIVRPGADPQAVRLKFEGAERLALDGEGNLILHTPGGQVLQKAPVIYQEIEGGRKTISGGYVLKEKGEVGFRVAAYDRSRPLVIDPVLAYSTYLGGSGEEFGRAIAVDNDGNAYVTGDTYSIDFPIANPIHPARGGTVDAFVVKLNSAGSVVYSTYLGGSGREFSNGIAVDASGNAYVTGPTESTDFPTVNPIYPTLAGFRDAFVTKLNAAGSALVYSTYLGGSGEDASIAIAVDASGNAYVTGVTYSSDFPTRNPIQGGSGGGQTDGFVAKLNAAGSALVYSTYLGGSSRDHGVAIAVDGGGSAYVTGATSSSDFPLANPFDAVFSGGGNDGDAYVTKLNAAGSALVYSTYLGGSGNEEGSGIAVDAEGNAYVTGFTTSRDFPTRNAFQSTYAGGIHDAFVTKLGSSGSALVYSTYLGGSRVDSSSGEGGGIAVDGDGNAYVTGKTTSTDFPMVNPIQAAHGGGTNDVVVAKLDPTGSALLFSTFLGGGGDDIGHRIAVDRRGNIYVTGWTTSTNFPTASPFQVANRGGTDVFVTKIGETSPNQPPVAQCVGERVGTDASSCTAPASVDAGSFDPDQGDPITLAQSPPGPYPLGNTNVTLNVTDPQGASNSCQAVVTVFDPIPPSVAAPPAATAECAGPSGTAVGLGPAAASDNCPGVQVSSDARPSYPLGTTPVTFTAVDGSGNTASATTTVTVRDTTAPALAGVPSAPIVAECASPSGTPVGMPAVTASDICQGSLPVTVQPTGPFPLGDSQVTFSAADRSGNAASGRATVRVVDTTPPVLANVPGPIRASADSSCRAAVAVPLPAASDRCDADVPVTSDSPGVFALGTTPIAFTARDDSGNTASARTSVTVVDATPPRAACNAPGSITPPQTPIFFTATAQDNCAVGSVRVTGYDCYFINPSGRRVDKTGSCVVQVNGDTITILDSGGVGTRITWNVEAADGSGNTASAACGVSVENPGQGRAGR